MEKFARGSLAFVAVVATTLLMLHPFIGGATRRAAAAATGGAGSNCTRSCGNIGIPYPFGVEQGCYRGSWFNLTCDVSYQPPRLLLGDGTVQVLQISIANGTVRINSSRLIFPGDDDAGVSSAGTWGRGLPHGGPYFLSETRSSVVLVGCGVQVNLRGGERNSLVASCSAFCPLNSSGGRIVVEASSACAGVGCCRANVVLGYDFYNIEINKPNGSVAFDLPASVYLVDQGFSNTEDIGSASIDGRYPEALPATLEWVVSNGNCPLTRNNGTALGCQSSFSTCLEESYNSIAHRGYRCACTDGYQGNSYVTDGCQDIDECTFPDDMIPCYGNCINTIGSFICRCPSGYAGNASVPSGCRDINECENPGDYSCYGVCQNFPGTFECQCPNGTYGSPKTKGGCRAIKDSSAGLSIGLGVGSAIIILVLALSCPFIMRKIKTRKIREKFFKQNHGLLLQQLISRNANISERMIITLRELEKATNNFDRNRVVGGGGHGIVFRGNLDLHVVAIKKSKIVVQKEIDDFINEVVVLSQVNHRNVVKLLGCCLETEVPLLIYEFISNGTLYHHLHGEGPTSLPWVDRFRIALEVARALSYLHSAASMPIFHRDVKTSNILLDDGLIAKVSDFGASRYITIDQTGVTTAVQGTIGYLDPMYYNTGRLTDKSDVFSFGVVLVELLTKKKPFFYRSDNGDSLVSQFTSLLIEGRLDVIIDPQIMNEEDEVLEVAALAALCTRLKGEDRPTMREVEVTLENLLKKKQVQCSTTRKRCEDNGTRNQYMSTERVNNEGSRQYTMEDEIMLSATYPR